MVITWANVPGILLGHNKYWYRLVLKAIACGLSVLVQQTIYGFINVTKTLCFRCGNVGFGVASVI